MPISTQKDDHNLTKNVATNKTHILRTIGLKFERPSVNILGKVAFWNKQKWLKSGTDYMERFDLVSGAGSLVGQSGKTVNFIRKKIFDSMKSSHPTFTVSASSVSGLTYFNTNFQKRRCF